MTASLAGPVGSAAWLATSAPAPVVEPTAVPKIAGPAVPAPSTTPTARATAAPASRSTVRPALKPKRSTYPVLAAAKLDWTALAQCESGGDPRSTNDGAGNYFGLYQFSVSTWRSVGGTGLPNKATAAEQTYRAELLYDQQGSSPWPNCGRHLRGR